jgi:hypothetical protein
VGGSDVPSGEALKQLESGLVKRAEERQLMFGQSWADVMQLCVKVARAFGSEPLPDLGELDITTTWASAEVRNDLLQSQAAQLHKALGVPDEKLWEMVGYSPDEVAGFKEDARLARAAEVASIADALRVNQTRNAPQTQPQTFVNGNGNR